MAEPLKYQTWTLRVPIHCEGCKKKVKKILQSIDGVYTTTVDSQQHKVTVTGNIEAETLLKRLARSGKPAQLWPEKKAKEKKEKTQQEQEQKQEQLPKDEKKDTHKTEKHDEKQNSNPVDENVSQKPESSSADDNSNNKPVNLTLENPEAAAIDGGTKPPEGGNDQNALGVEPTESHRPPVGPTAVPDKPTRPVSVGPPCDLGPMAMRNVIEPSGYSHFGPMNHPGNPHLRPIMNNFGPMNHPGGPHLGPMNQQGSYYPPAHHRPPMVGVSYSMAQQPSSVGSYYTPPPLPLPPPYGYPPYPHYPVTYMPPPPPPLPIRDVHDDYCDYDDDNSSQCRVM